MKNLFVAIACVLIVVLSGCGAEGPSEQVEVVEQAELVRKPLNDYTWDELSEISKRIQNAGSDEAGREVAKEFGIVEEDGSLTTQTKQIVLNGTRALDVRVAGVLHDSFADRDGKCGLTFMSVGALEIKPMNTSASVEGGWEASYLRAWLDTSGLAMFDPELSRRIPYVNKMTNNIGRTDEYGSVTPTRDRLFVFSAREVCGDIHWDSEEFRHQRGYEDIDGILGLEGEQYECFVQAGITYDSDPNHFLSLAETTGASPWWYRSAYPFEFYGKGETGTAGYFFQVRESGYPESLGSPEMPASVVVGFAIA